MPVSKLGSTVLIVCVSVVAAGCRGGTSAARYGAADAAPAAAGKHWGELMTEVGHRFERAGRAVLAGRWELAAYDLHELDEVLDDDLPHAPRPEDIHTDLLPLARAMVTNGVEPLQRAAEARDRAAFEAAFARTAALCNDCHRASQRAFIEVPRALGAAVPVLDPVAPPGPAAPASDGAR